MQAHSSLSLATERRLTLTLGSVFALRMFGLFMLLPVFSVVGLSLDGATPALIGTALGIYGLTQAILQIPFGALSDLYGRRLLIIIGLLLFILGGAVAACSDSIWGVIVGRAIQGAGAISSVVMALLSDLIEESRRPKALALVGMSIGVTFVSALMLGPVLVDWFGLSGLFWLNVLLGCAALAMVVFAVPSAKPVERHHGVSSATRFYLALKHHDLWVLNGGIFVLHLVLTGLFILLPTHLATQLSLPIGQHSRIYFLAIVLSIPVFLPVLMAARRLAVKSLMLMSVGLLSLGLLLLLLPMGVVGITVALIVFFAGFNALEALLPSQVGSTAPVAARGTSMGVYSSAQFLGIFFGAQLAGWLAPELGLRLMVSLMVVVMCGWGVWVLLRPSLRKLVTRHWVLGGNNLLTDTWQKSLLNIRGVEEAVVIESERMLMLKVDESLLDEIALQACLAEAESPA